MGVSAGLRKALRERIEADIKRRAEEWDQTSADMSIEHLQGDWRVDKRIRPYNDILLERVPRFLWEGHTKHAYVVDIIVLLRRMRKLRPDGQGTLKAVDEFTGHEMALEVFRKITADLQTGSARLVVVCMDNQFFVPKQKGATQRARSIANTARTGQVPYPNGCTITDDGLLMPGSTAPVRFSVERVVTNRSLRSMLMRYLVEHCQQNFAGVLAHPGNAMVFDFEAGGATAVVHCGDHCITPDTGLGGISNMEEAGEADIMCAYWAAILNKHMPVVVESIDSDFMFLLSRVSEDTAHNPSGMKSSTYQISHRYPLILVYHRDNKKGIARENCVDIHRLVLYVRKRLRMTIRSFCCMAALCGCDFSRKELFRNMGDADVLNGCVEFPRLIADCTKSPKDLERLGRTVWEFQRDRKMIPRMAVYEEKKAEYNELKRTMTPEERAAKKIRCPAKPRHPPEKVFVRDMVRRQYQEVCFVMEYWGRPWKRFMDTSVPTVMRCLSDWVP